MLPLRDEIPSRRTPYINYLLIAINVIVFIWQYQVGLNNPSVVYQFALIPSQVTHGVTPGAILHIFSSMFMHGGLAHIGGNMLLHVYSWGFNAFIWEHVISMDLWG